MTDLNRRNLLAILASVPLFGRLIAQGQRRSPKPRQTRSEATKLTLIAPPKWPVSSTPPADTNPGVRLIFQGLTSFCHKGKECEITFFRDDSHHQLDVKVVEITDKCRQIFATTDGNNPIFIKKMSVEVDGKDSNVSFFHVGAPGDFDRVTGHRKDFWWLLDFDGIYGKKHDKEKTKSKLTVKNGQFYTYQRTNSKFKGYNGPFPALGKDLGYIAKVMAVDIPLNLGQSVLLKINGSGDVVRPLKLNSGTRYEVYFSNECWKADGTKCSDSDFDLNFKITKLLPEEKFRLTMWDEGDDDAPLGLCITPEYIEQRRRRKKKGTDRAPCMGVGFGEGGGFE